MTNFATKIRCDISWESSAVSWNIMLHLLFLKKQQNLKYPSSVALCQFKANETGGNTSMTVTGLMHICTICLIFGITNSLCFAVISNNSYDYKGFLHVVLTCQENRTELNRTQWKVVQTAYIYLRNKETQQTLRVTVSIQYDASF